MQTKNRIISLPSGVNFELVYVQGGIFAMGSDDPESPDREKPAHQVELFDFFIGRYAVTQEVWQAVMNSNSSSFKGEKRPVDAVSWKDTQDFFSQLNKLTGKDFRLPTEAEWEYAARGGQYSQGYKYAGSDRLKQVGWYNENSKKQTQEVGQLLANELGLHDMSGNVYEWCQDRFDKKYYAECKKTGIVHNPQGPATGTDRVIRGGGYFRSPLNCRSVTRDLILPGERYDDFGFRLVLPFQLAGG